MPKKKPIAKRLDKLFDEIKHEDPSAKPKAVGPRNAPEEKTRPSSESNVHLTIRGISFRSSSETGILPWNAITQIRHIKPGYLIEGENHRLVVGREREPTAIQPGFFKSFLSTSRYAKELIDQIRQLAPHVYYRQSFLDRYIFSKN